MNLYIRIQRKGPNRAIFNMPFFVAQRSSRIPGNELRIRRRSPFFVLDGFQDTAEFRLGHIGPGFRTGHADQEEKGTLGTIHIRDTTLKTLPSLFAIVSVAPIWDAFRPDISVAGFPWNVPALCLPNAPAKLRGLAYFGRAAVSFCR